MQRTRSFQFVLVIVIVAAVLATGSAQAQAYNETVLYTFAGGTDGVNPRAGLVRDAQGNLYGTTFVGGDLACNAGSGCGTVFKLDTTGKETVLYSFTGTGGDGALPVGGLVLDAQGNLYGTTSSGGNPACNAGYGCGTVFKLDTTGKETVLHSFTDYPDGVDPEAGLVLDAQGNLYGTTLHGGGYYLQYGLGTVFKVDATGNETVLYSFTGIGDGELPYAGLLQDTQGNLYGTTGGSVFKVAKAGKLTTLYLFTGGGDGGDLHARLVQDTQGNLYGTASQGGTYGFGTVFKLDTTGKLTVLHTFTFTQGDGAYPEAGLVQDTQGNLYGTTVDGGTYGYGTVFKVDTTGKETVLYSFTGTNGDGAAPLADLVQDAQGNLYGTTGEGGDLACLTQPGYGCGTVFKLTPALQFVAITPCRLVDTRNADGTFGGPPIQGGTYRSFPIPQSNCNIPATAAAYSLNVTVVPPGPLGYLTIWPTGENQPGVSTLNSVDGRVKANAAIVPAGTSGAVSVFVSNTSDVVLDIDGYFATPSNSTLAFYPLPPCRVADTRNNNYPQGLGAPSLSGGVPRDFPILMSNCQIPNTAQAYSFNFTAVPHGPLGYLTVWPAGLQQPGVSTLNDLTGTVVANAAIVPAGTDKEGSIEAFVSNDSDLVIDVNGYFAPPGQNGLSLYSVAPCRVLDTRNGNGQFVGELMPPVDVVDSVCGPSALAQAYVFNATVVPPGPLGYLTLWPDLGQQPGVSTLNAVDGAVTSNMAIVPTTNGKIDAFASNLTQLVLDISAYFAP